MIDRTLSDNDLKRLLNVYMARHYQGDNVRFLDSTESDMNELFPGSKRMLSSLENTLAMKMGYDNFKTHYEHTCYYLLYEISETGTYAQETFWISEQYTPLMCLKMAHRMGEEMGINYRILLSDKVTEVDPELLAFAISET